jgi:hypothetical protein
MMSKGRETATADREERPLPTPATVAAPVPAKVPAKSGPVREKLGTQMQLDLQVYLKDELTDILRTTRKRVTLAELLEALVLEYRDDPQLRQQIRERLTSD